jgi:hypothetical protein
MVNSQHSGKWVKNAHRTVKSTNTQPSKARQETGAHGAIVTSSCSIHSPTNYSSIWVTTRPSRPPKYLAGSGDMLQSPEGGKYPKHGQ